MIKFNFSRSINSMLITQSIFIRIKILFSMGNKPTVSKSAEKRIKDSNLSRKMMEYSEAYGRLSGSTLQKWIDENYSDQINSVTYCTFKKPSYRKSKQDMVDTFQKAYDKNWRIKIIQIVDVTTSQDKQIIDSIYRFTCPNPSNFFKKVELFYQFHGQVNKNSGKWVKTQHKQYVDQSVVSIKYRDYSPVRHVRTSPEQQTYSSSSSQSYSSNQYSSNEYSSNQYSNNNAIEENRRREERQRKQREERSRKENEDRQRRERQSAQQHRRQQQQAAERDRRYRQQQQRFRQNMRRQEQAQREYRRQQQQQAEQRQREYMTALSKRR